MKPLKAAAIWLVAAAVVVGLGVMLDKQASASVRFSDCPKGYVKTEVRIYGQRMEAGIDPQTGDRREEVVQNDRTDPKDHPGTYVVALACARGMNGTEAAFLMQRPATLP